MCVFALAGMIIFGYRWGALDFSLKAQIVIGWIACNCYLIFWMFINKPWCQPLVLVLLDAWLYVRLLGFFKQCGLPGPFNQDPLPMQDS